MKDDQVFSADRTRGASVNNAHSDVAVAVAVAYAVRGFIRKHCVRDSRVEQYVGTESNAVPAVTRQRDVVISVLLIIKSKWRANRREQQIGRK